MEFFLFRRHLSFGIIKVTSELLSKMQDILPLYMIPNKIHIIDEIPLTNNKKINRKLLELMN